MIFRRKNKKVGIPKKCFEPPLEHRFTFVPKGLSYYQGYVVQISGKVSSEKRAFYAASEIFCRDYPDMAKGGVAVFYGNVDCPDCKDVLYGAYNSFENKKVRKLK